MRTMFIDNDMKIEPRKQGPYTTAVSIEIVQYDDGFELNVYDNYEGHFDMEFGNGTNMKEMMAVLQNFVKTEVLMRHQLMRIRCSRVSMSYPRKDRRTSAGQGSNEAVTDDAKEQVEA